MKPKKRFNKILVMGTILTLLTLLGVSLVLAQNTTDSSMPLNVRLNRLQTQADRTMGQANRLMSRPSIALGLPGLQDDTAANDDTTEPDVVSPPWTGFHGDRRGGFGFMDAHHGFLGNANLLATTADLLGMTIEEVTTALAEGQSIADLAATNEVDVQTIIDAYIATVESALETAVAAEELTREQADLIQENLTNMIETRVNQTRPDRFDRDQMPFDRFHSRGNRLATLTTPNLLEIVANALDMPVSAVVAELSDGNSIADVVANYDGDLDAITGTFLAEAEASLATAVADGGLTQEQATVWLEQISIALESRLTETWDGGHGRGAGDCPGHSDSLSGPQYGWRGHGHGGFGRPDSNQGNQDSRFIPFNRFSGNDT